MKRAALTAVGLIAWVAVGFIGAQLLVGGVLWLLSQVIDFSGANKALFNATVAAIIYIIALLIVIGGPYWLRRRATTKEDVGLARLPNWVDIGVAPVAFVVYMIVSGIVMYLASILIPGFQVDQVQEVGFSAASLSLPYEYVLAFVTLVIIAPVAEELLLRGYLYGKLKKHIPRWVAIILVSALFGVLHGQWNVAIDTFVLSVFLCLLRDLTGALWPAMLLHMLKNGIAYYLLFVNPMLLNSLGG